MWYFGECILVYYIGFFLCILVYCCGYCWLWVNRDCWEFFEWVWFFGWVLIVGMVFDRELLFWLLFLVLCWVCIVVILEVYWVVGGLDWVLMGLVEWWSWMLKLYCWLLCFVKWWDWELGCWIVCGWVLVLMCDWRCCGLLVGCGYRERWWGKGCEILDWLVYECYLSWVLSWCWGLWWICWVFLVVVLVVWCGWRICCFCCSWWLVWFFFIL